MWQDIIEVILSIPRARGLAKASLSSLRASLWIFFAVLLAWPTLGRGAENTKAAMAVLDVMSASLTPSKRNILTDVMRTELFKLHLFQLVDRGMIQKVLDEQKLGKAGIIEERHISQIGRHLEVEKLMVCYIEKFGETFSVNVRVVSVKTSVLEFTDNLFVQNEKQLFNALKDMVKTVEVQYTFREEGSPKSRKEKNELQWKKMGATEEQMKYLSTHAVEVEPFLDIRQYDITFTIAEFVEIRERHWDPETVKSFLQEGISYPSVKKALKFGIVNLDNYKREFRPYQLSFEDYLDAYENHILRGKEYKRFKKTYRKDYGVLSIGGLADSLPVAKANFSKFTAELGWEHYWTKHQRKPFKFSTTTGLFYLPPYVPVPYHQANVYMGKYPFYAFLSAGGMFEVIFGGHAAFYLRTGMEIKNRFGWSLMGAWGNQPSVSYMNGKPKEDPEYKKIKFPYWALLFTVKI